MTETNPKKVNMILISKADLLTPRQRWVWPGCGFVMSNTSCFSADKFGLNISVRTPP